MGYRSDVVIAVHKSVYDRHLLLGSVPKVFQEEEPTVYEEAYYWYLECQKWYSDYPEVQEVAKFLALLAETEEDIPTHFDRETKEPEFRRGPYAFLRTGEDNGDTEEDGDPSGYDLYINTSIDVPFA